MIEWKKLDNFPSHKEFYKWQLLLELSERQYWMAKSMYIFFMNRDYIFCLLIEDALTFRMLYLCVLFQHVLVIIIILISWGKLKD